MAKKRFNNINSARDLGTINRRRNIKGAITRADKNDFYEFDLSSSSSVSIRPQRVQSNLRIRLFDGDRDRIGQNRFRSKGNKRRQTFERDLEAGTYFIQVRGNTREGRDRYRLRLQASALAELPPPVPEPVPEPVPTGNDTLATAIDLGVVTATTIRNDSIGEADEVDFYKFTLNDIANLDVRTEGGTVRRVQLIRDDNGNGLVDDGEVFAPSGSSSFRPLDMPPGEYFIRLEGFTNLSGDYTLTVVPSLFGGNVSPEPGNTLDLASNELGTFSGTRTFKEYVGALDEIDIYQFTLNDLSNLQVTFSGSSREVKVQLIRDDNNNGLIDSGEIFASREQIGDSGTLNQDLPVGNYFILVQPEINSSFSTSYEMTVVGTPYGGNGAPDPGNTLSEARNLGTLTGTTSLKEYVGVLDSDDFYRFTLSSAANLQARITRSTDFSSTTNLNVNVIRDDNNNGQIDDDEVVDFGVNGLTDDFEAGTYFFRVTPRNSAFSTNYELDLVVT